MHAETGIVHENVHGLGGVFESLHDFRDIGPLREVRGQHFDVATHAPKFMGHLLEAVFVARDEDDVVALRGQLPSEGGADARRPPRDESDTHVLYSRACPA